MQRGFAPILLILLVVVLGIGSYFAYTSLRGVSTKSDDVAIYSSPNPTPTASNPPRSADMLNLQLFEDKIFGISFNFPSSWKPEQRLIDPKKEYMQLLIDFKAPDQSIKTPDVIKLFYVYNPNKLSLADLNSKLSGNSGNGPGLISPDDTEVRNHNGIISQYSGHHNCTATCESYTWSHNDQVFQLIKYPQQNIENQAEVFGLIFATFKFAQ